MIGSLAIGRAAVSAALLLALPPPFLHRRALLRRQALEIGAALLGRHVADVPVARGRRGGTSLILPWRRCSGGRSLILNLRRGRGRGLGLVSARVRRGGGRHLGCRSRPIAACVAVC